MAVPIRADVHRKWRQNIGLNATGGQWIAHAGSRDKFLQNRCNRVEDDCDGLMRNFLLN
jgi:hypothetical protein